MRQEERLENAGTARGWRARRAPGSNGGNRKKPPATRASRKRMTREKNIRMAMRQKGLV